MPRTMSVCVSSTSEVLQLLEAELTVDVTETGRLALLRMMQTSSPVDRNITLAPVQPCSALHTASSRDPTKLKQPIKHRTIIPDIILPLLFGERVHIIWRHTLQEVHILVGVELCHLVLGGGLGAVDFEFLVEAVVHDEAVGHSDAVGLHRMAGVVGVVAHVGVVEVGDFLRLGCSRSVSWGVGAGPTGVVGVESVLHACGFVCTISAVVV